MQAYFASLPSLPLVSHLNSIKFQARLCKSLRRDNFKFYRI
ncbi:hypothetical protein CAMGR0001_1154 [Campylobacter gracilis RM3268]|uniref:Uncharacterized protein n=1 Tax=Campylobacter gracilis RM3268 TaxID=553220 RepID=C8PIV5_9BACT|nr:hypothetical protein CAMGR0001_1154 [Campylobacter gracilis RM3268]